MITWKYSFNRLNEEQQIAKKKQQALDKLYETGKISQSTRDAYNTEITQALSDIEKQQKQLFEKMQLKITELQTQIKTLEMLLTNYEIQHAIGEIDEATYQNEVTLLNNALDTAKTELHTINDASLQLYSPLETPIIEPASTPEPTIEITPTPEPEPTPAENIQIAPPEPEIIPEICNPETTTAVNPEPDPVPVTEAESFEQPTAEAYIEAPQTEPQVETAAEVPVEAPAGTIIIENTETVETVESSPDVEPPIETQSTLEAPVEVPSENVIEAENPTILEDTQAPVEAPPEETVAVQVETPADVVADSAELIEETPEVAVEAPIEDAADTAVEESVPVEMEAEPEVFAMPAETVVPQEIEPEVAVDAVAEAEPEATVEAPVEVSVEPEVNAESEAELVDMPETETLADMPETPSLEIPANPPIEGAEVSLGSVAPLQADSPIEIVPQEIIQPIKEATSSANPTEAPEEAHPDTVAEDVEDQVEGGEDSQAVDAASVEENCETQDS